MTNDAAAEALRGYSAMSLVREQAAELHRQAEGAER